MVEGKKKIDTIPVEDIMHLTNGGREIYEKYLGKVGKIMKRPWGSDKHPSWGIFCKEDVWMWKDQAKEEAGGPVQFVQRLFNISYGEAIQKICFDFKLDTKEIKADRVFKIQEKTSTSYVHITARIQKFKPRHHQFWNAVDVTEDWCKKHNCFAVKELAINRQKITIGTYEIVFVYLAPDIEKVKVYFPDREEGARFRTNVPYNYLWNHSSCQKCDKLVIHKSMKDLITFAQLHPHNVATQNESVKVFNPEMVEKINNLSPEPWVFYGSDTDGVNKCKQVTAEHKWKYINTPKAMLPEINDVYSFVKKHGLKKLEEFCKQKHLL
jgi:hypothetical protein